MKFSVAVTVEKKPDWFSRLIMWRLKSNFSHSVIIVDNDVYQSTKTGFGFTPLSVFLKDRKIVDILPMEPANYNFAVGWLTGKLDTEYSTSQYIGILFPFLRRFFKNKSEKMFCSEAQYLFAVRCCGMPDYLDQDFADPKAVWRTIKRWKLFDGRGL